MATKALIFAPLLLQLLCGTASGLDPSQPAGSYIRTTFTAENGLPSNVINAAIQTRDGFLWLGTSSGLVRFDGHHFTRPRISSPILASRPSLAMAESPDGDLWVSTGVGVLKITRANLNQSAEFSPVIYHAAPGAGDHVDCLFFARNGVLWAGSVEGLYRFEKGAFRQVIPKLAIARIQEDKNGRILLATGRGFAEWDGTRTIYHPELVDKLGVKPDKMYHMFEDRAGVMWYCTSRGIARESGGKIGWLTPYDKPGKTEALLISEDASGNTWIALSGGLFRATSSAMEPVAPGVAVKYTYSDRDGNLWICTNGAGLIQLKDRSVRILTLADGLPNDVTMAVLQTSDGKLWAGNNCGGLSVYNGSTFRTYSEKDGLANSCVATLAEDGRKDLWIGTFGGGVFRFRDGRFKQFSVSDGLVSSIVRRIVTSRDGSLWIGTRDGISHLINEGSDHYRFRNYTIADGLSGRSAVSIYEDRDGVLWTTTLKGIDRLEGDRFVHLEGVPEATMYWLLGEDQVGGLYTELTPAGTFRIEGKRIVNVRANLDVSVLKPGKDLWFCGDSLSRAAPDAFWRWTHEPGEPPDFREFGIEDGLKTRSCATSGYPGMAITKDAKLWVATWQGLAVVDLPRLSSNNREPALYVEDVAVGKRRFAAGKELVLEPDTHHVELYFSAIELTSPEKIHFQYRLDGVDSDWLDAGTERKAIYTNFAPGKHSFRVRACNSDGIWDRVGIAYSITQRPHYYETSLFRFAVFGFSLLLIFGLYRFRLGQMAAQLNARLDERVAERTRLARDLHDTLLQTIHASALIVHSARESQGNPRTIGDALEKLDLWLARAQEEARSALHALRNSSAETNDLTNALQDAGNEFTSSTGIAFQIQTEGRSRSLHPVVRDEMLQIGREAIRNAFRHSQAKRVEVTVKYGRGLTLRVCDDGKGIDADTATHGKAGHFGLRGMQERASRIGGKLAVAARQGGGTEVELWVPGAGGFGTANIGDLA